MAAVVLRGIRRISYCNGSVGVASGENSLGIHVRIRSIRRSFPSYNASYTSVVGAIRDFIVLVNQDFSCK